MSDNGHKDQLGDLDLRPEEAETVKGGIKDGTSNTLAVGERRP